MLELTRADASAASSRDTEGHAMMVHNVILSHEDEISPATVTIMYGEGERT